MSIAKIGRQLLWLSILSFFIYKNIVSWHSAGFGAIVFVAYLFFVGARTRALLVEWFTFSRTAWRVRVLALFLTIIFLSWFSGVTIIFGWINSFSIAISFWLTGFLVLILENVFVNKSDHLQTIDSHSILDVWEEAPSAKIGIILYIILLALAAYYLIISHTDEAVLSPWQVLNKNYFTYFFLATMVLGYLLFTKIKVKFLLFFLCLHSLLLHAYLPATHTLFYGADQWRHLATENVLVTENNLTPTELRTDEVGNKFDLGRVSYAQYHAAGIILARLMQVDLLAFNQWFIPIIWAIILPLLLYEWGRTLGGDKKIALILVWLGFLPYTWQASGSFSLPVNFGFLIWFLITLLWFRRKEENKFTPTMVMVFLGAMLFLGYIMYFLIFWQMIIIYFFATQTKKWKNFGRLSTNLFLVFVLGLFLPLSEIIFGYSALPKTWAWIENVKQFIGNFSSYYLASGPRSHDIINGNIIFNQLPSYAWVNNFLLSNRYGLMLAAILIFSLVIFETIRTQIKNEGIEAVVTGRLLLSLFIGYFLGRYILVGEGVLSRRLDVLLAWGIVTLLYVYIIKFIESKWWNKLLVKNLAIIFFAAIISASYSLGPDTKALSVNEYKAMQYVWNREAGVTMHCVLADTYPLLALEAISRRKIIAGNFPINRYFAQPERVALLNNANHGEEWLVKAKELTSAERCWLVTRIENINSDPQEHFGHIGVYKF